MIKRILFMYRPAFAKTLVYMLQATEYNVGAYFKWLFRVSDFRKVMYRRELIMTGPAKLLLVAVRAGLLIQLAIAAFWLAMLIGNPLSWQLPVAVALLISAPLVWMFVAVVPLLLGRWLVIGPLTWLRVSRSKRIFANHKAIKIAVAGSYGKTTMKEMLLTVLSQGKKVAATPANRNVASSHAQFAKSLTGDEDLLIVEFGEGAPGDVTKFSKTVRPNVGVITGLAPAHLDKYKTLEAAGRDIFSLARFVSPQKLYVNADNQASEPFIDNKYRLFSQHQAAGWKVAKVKSDIHGLKFDINKGKRKLSLHSHLIGRHQIGPLAMAAVLGLELGLSPEQVVAGVSKIRPFEHRMQPRQLHGGWLIDDTYNGNIEGMKAGLALLAELKAGRKIYITPGLVDQGGESAAVHQQLGKYIAQAKPDIVVLMQHSVTADIEQGMKANGFKGKLMIEDDPLNFYNNLDQFMAAGDLVLMQNDWPDNYN